MFFRPSGADLVVGLESHGLRRGLHSFAASRLRARGSDVPTIFTQPEGSRAVTDVTEGDFPSQVRTKMVIPMYFLNSPLQFFAFIWYKQFTESKVWQSGIFV